MQIKSNTDNLRLLHIFRTGGSIQYHNKDIVIKEWNNLRFNNFPYPKTNGMENIKTVDIRHGLPFPENSFDAVYTFHISEHLTWHDNIKFNKEILRILKPGGVCRQSTPDLHIKIVDYLDKLKSYRENQTNDNRKQYYWSVYTLVDQLARTKSGGEMLKALKSKNFDSKHVEETHGDVFRKYYSNDYTFKNVEFKRNLIYYLYSFLRKILWLTSRNRPNEFLENERFYFDEISYRKIMELSGFAEVDCPTYKSSRIPMWEKYQLDTSEFGDYPLEPSVFVEGIKP